MWFRLGRLSEHRGTAQSAAPVVIEGFAMRNGQGLERTSWDWRSGAGMAVRYWIILVIWLGACFDYLVVRRHLRGEQSAKLVNETRVYNTGGWIRNANSSNSNVKCSQSIYLIFYNYIVILARKRQQFCTQQIVLKYITITILFFKFQKIEINYLIIYKIYYWVLTNIMYIIFFNGLIHRLLKIEYKVSDFLTQFSDFITHRFKLLYIRSYCKLILDYNI